MFTIKDHVLYKDDVAVKYIQAPDFNDNNINPMYVIMHYTGDLNKGQAVSWLTKKDDTPVSAHIVVELDGTVIQTVKLNKRAYHAGVSQWGSINGLNSFSIGIELVNPGRLTKQGDKYFFGKTEISVDKVIKAKHKNEDTEGYWYLYPEVQLQVAEQLAQTLMSHYNMKDILGHDDISPRRKSDPGPAFPMDRIKGNVQKDVSNCSTIKVTTSNLNLRTQPSTNAKVITVVPNNIPVKVLGVEGDWLRVDYNNVLGYISSKYTK